jgi:DNA primase
MVRIADNELERIKREVKVEGLARSRGVEPEHVGSRWRGRCPLHNDGTPSLFIDPEKNVRCCR